jgi:hypothetical protein
MLILEIEKTGLKKVSIEGDPIGGLQLSNLLAPWIEAIDAAAVCVSDSDGEDVDESPGASHSDGRA